jgi:hypothetical protein
MAMDKVNERVVLGNALKETEFWKSTQLPSTEHPSATI